MLPVKSKKAVRSYTDSDSALPEDCTEISYDDAVLLSGDSDPFPTPLSLPHTYGSGDNNSSVGAMREGNYEHGTV